MTGAALGLRSTGSYGSLQQHQQQQQQQNGGAVLPIQSAPGGGRKGQKMFASGTKEKEKGLSRICKPCLPIRVSMFLVAMASLGVLMIITTGFGRVGDVPEIPGVNGVSPFSQGRRSFSFVASVPPGSSSNSRSDKRNMEELSSPKSRLGIGANRSLSPLPVPYKSPFSVKHPCESFSFPPPPADRKRTGPRPCPVCYVPVEDAFSLMPSAPSASPILKSLTYASEERSTINEQKAGSPFGGRPSLERRNESFNIKESMMVHCGFVNGNRPGNGTGFDIDVADLLEMERCSGVVVASAIFGNYDIMQQPKNISDIAKKRVCFYMFVDEETEAYLKNSSTLDNTNRVGLWRVVVVRNLPYADPRRNGKVPKLLLHRIFPNARFSLWIDGKLEVVVDPYQILERFLWRKNATFAISRHYRRFDVFEEADANKAGGKYDNSSIDQQIEFYKKEGLSHYSSAKLPITSDVPEGCVIIRENTPISNLFTCLWFNEVDRFTSRDQLSFSTVRDKIMSKVNWKVEMFMDCERRSFVVQGYHRDVLEQKMAAAANSRHPPVHPPPPPQPQREVGPERAAENPPRKVAAPKRGREKKPSSRRGRPRVANDRDKSSI